MLTIFANQIEINERKLIRQATTDSLTGIANRHHFFEQGQRLIKQANSSKTPLVVCVLDFDHFKKINDQYGHFIGDVCLTEISKLIQEHCRKNDLFARIGGEEFALIFPLTSLATATLLTNKIRKAIEAYAIAIIDQKNLHCTASFGLASKSEHSEELKTLLIYADKALYQAKSLGRNQVKSYNI